MAVIIKNTTLTLKTWGGKDYDASSQYTAQEVDRYRLLSDSVFLSDLSSGYAVVNDGVSDISDIETAKALIRGLTASYLDDDAIVPATGTLSFQGNVSMSTANGVTNVVVGGGSGSGALVGSLYTVSFTSTGSSDNKWLGCYDKDLKGNETLVISPCGMDLIGYSISSSDSGANCVFEVWRSNQGSGSTKTKVYNINVTNFRTFMKTNITPISFAAGSKFAVYIKDLSGSDIKDPLVTLMFRITGFVSTEYKENFSSDF
jgi:hypothetical protein